MASLMPNMYLLQLQAHPKALVGALKSSTGPKTSQFQGTHKLSLLSSFLTNQNSGKLVNRSFSNGVFNARCCLNYSDGECGEGKDSQMEEREMAKLEDFHGFVLHLLKKSALPGAVALVPFLLDTEKAFAVTGEFGILEGRTASLIHPIVMVSLFVYTLWAGYLGWQWRRVRTIQEEINELKKQVKPRPKEEGEAPPPPSPIETKIQQLTEERKDLLKGSYRDRHFNAGSLLLGFGVFESVGGGVNTWMRTGKLFPGPHLFAGAGITVLWALAAALVPAMQKGNDLARNLHITLNTVNVILFIWQIPTGIDILLKVFEFTKWP